jgi:hypothetical protein
MSVSRWLLVAALFVSGCSAEVSSVPYRQEATQPPVHGVESGYDAGQVPTGLGSAGDAGTDVRVVQLGDACEQDSDCEHAGWICVKGVAKGFCTFSCEGAEADCTVAQLGSCKVVPGSPVNANYLGPLDASSDAADPNYFDCEDGWRDDAGGCRISQPVAVCVR